MENFDFFHSGSKNPEAKSKSPKSEFTFRAQ